MWFSMPISDMLCNIQSIFMRFTLQCHYSLWHTSIHINIASDVLIHRTHWKGWSFTQVESISRRVLLNLSTRPSLCGWYGVILVFSCSMIEPISIMTSILFLFEFPASWHLKCSSQSTINIVAKQTHQLRTKQLRSTLKRYLAAKLG